MIVLNNGVKLQNGKYTIIKILGEGSFGITYLAEMQMSQMDDMVYYVTIKEFFMSTMNTRSADGSSVEHTESSLVKDYKRKFIREAENLMHLQHENIVKVKEVFEENNTAYYVMEYLDGGSLNDLIEKKQRLTVPQTIDIIKQVCVALEYMHQNRMLHLDLKPKNIMLTSTGKVKLIDFGLSKQYKENGEPEDSTTIGLGTVGYAPIEQAAYRQDGSLPVTLDVYALGATIYKMLTGVTLPDSSSVLNNGLPLQPLWQAGVGQQLIWIIRKALEPMKANRFQSVWEVEVQLKNITNSSSSQPPPPPQPPPFPPPPPPLQQSLKTDTPEKEHHTMLPMSERIFNGALLLAIVCSVFGVIILMSSEKGKEFLSTTWGKVVKGYSK